MLGYIGSPNPFNNDGWFDTKDLVKQKDDFIKIVGRDTDLINVGGLKFMTSEISNIALQHKDIIDINVYCKKNSLTGNHVEAIIELIENSLVSKLDLHRYFNKKLPSHMSPQKIIFKKIGLNHRLKKNLNKL